MTEFIAGIAIGALLSLSSMVAYMLGKRNGAIRTTGPPKVPVKPSRATNGGNKIVKPLGKGRMEVELNEHVE